MARANPLKILLLGLAAALTSPAAPSMAQETAQETAVIGHRAVVSVRGAELRLELAGGERVRISLLRGNLRINGSRAGTYTRGGDVEQTWRALLEGVGSLETAEMLRAVHEWSMDVSGVEGDDLATMVTIHETVVSLTAVQAAIPEVPIIIAPEPGVVIDLSDLSEITAEAVEQGLSEARAALRDIQARETFEEAMREAEARQGGVRVVNQPPGASFSGTVANIVSDAASLFATFVALSFMGLGFMFFAPRQLEAVSDTVWHSFGRSFMAGLFATPLVIPAFGMMIIGLVLTVVGILVLPFAVIGFLVALMLALVGGYVAVARTVGEIYLRRRMARGKAVGGLLNYKYLLFGLAGLLLIWAPAVAFQSVPVAGTILVVGAGVSTWTLATAGFGATILSRAGVRGTIVRRLDRALTDEHYWPDSDVSVTGSRQRSAGSGQ